MISVCIATYNGKEFIKEQLDSIRAQLAENDEIIISDDMSTDGTAGVISEIQDPRVRLYAHSKKKERFAIDYATRNFENALRHASGDIIFLADQDDVWLPGKVEKMASALKHCDIVMSDCKMTDSSLNVTALSYYKNVRPFKASLCANFVRPAFLGSCMAFRRRVLSAALPFPRCGVGHDLWLGMVGLRCFNFRFIDEPLMLYRRHQTSVTDAGINNGTTLFFKLHYRFYVMKSFCKLLFMRKNDSQPELVL